MEESRREIKQRNHGQNLSSLMKVMKENIQESHPTLKRWDSKRHITTKLPKRKDEECLPSSKKTDSSQTKDPQ